MPTRSSRIGVMMGHEIAHANTRHRAERMGKQQTRIAVDSGEVSRGDSSQRARNELPELVRIDVAIRRSGVIIRCKWQ